MTPNLLSIQPLPFANDIDGTPLDQGYVYIGQPGIDPQINPLSVFWDSAALFPAAQPLRTSMGRIYNNGAPAPLYVTGDYSLRVLNKNGAQVTLAPNVNPLAGSSGADMVGYIQLGAGAVKYSVQDRLRKFVLVSDFDVKADGTDETVKIQAALNSFGVSGGILYFPRGTYRASALTVPDGVILSGEGLFATALLCNHLTATLLTLGVSCGVRDMNLGASVAKTAGYHINAQGNRPILERLTVSGYYIAMRFGTLGGVQVVDPQIHNCNFFSPVIVAGGGAVLFENFSNATMTDCVGAGPNAGNQPDFGIRFLNGDTGYVANVNFTKHGKALQINPGAGFNCYAVSFVNATFDSAGNNASGAACSSAEISPAGGVYNTKFTNLWAGLSVAANGLLIAPTGAGKVDGTSIAGSEFPDNGDCGFLQVDNGAATVLNTNITGGGSGSNTNSALRFAGATSFFSVVNHTCGNWSNRGPNNIGITVDAAASGNYTIAHNLVRGNTTSAIVDGGSGSNAQVYGNNGYNGAANVVGLAVGASPWAYTAGHTPEMIYVLGGTVTAIDIDGATVQNATGATIPLLPNELMSITYAVLPTVLRKRA